jgi:hypothetical protein
VLLHAGALGQLLVASAVPLARLDQSAHIGQAGLQVAVGLPLFRLVAVVITDLPSAQTRGRLLLLGTLRQETWTPGGWGRGKYFPVLLPIFLFEPSDSKGSVLIAVAF